MLAATIHKQLCGRRCHALTSNGESTLPADLNQLTTRLNQAVAAEDYRLASRIKARLAEVAGPAAQPPLSWQAMGLPDWLIDRAERLGYRLPTDVQQRAARSMLLGADVLVRAPTGSGKTLAVLMPALAMLDYPPITCAFTTAQSHATS